jgi:hypothetical protein
MYILYILSNHIFITETWSTANNIESDIIFFWIVCSTCDPLQTGSKYSSVVCFPLPIRNQRWPPPTIWFKRPTHPFVWFHFLFFSSIPFSRKKARLQKNIMSLSMLLAVLQVSVFHCSFKFFLLVSSFESWRLDSDFGFQCTWSVLQSLFKCAKWLQKWKADGQTLIRTSKEQKDETLFTGQAGWNKSNERLPVS